MKSDEEIAQPNWNEYTWPHVARKMLLGVSKSSIYRYIAEGKLIAVKTPGGALLISKQSINQLINKSARRAVGV